MGREVVRGTFIGRKVVEGRGVARSGATGVLVGGREVVFVGTDCASHERTGTLSKPSSRSAALRSPRCRDVSSACSKIFFIATPILRSRLLIWSHMWFIQLSTHTCVLRFSAVSRAMACD